MIWNSVAGDSLERITKNLQEQRPAAQPLLAIGTHSATQSSPEANAVWAENEHRSRRKRGMTPRFLVAPIAVCTLLLFVVPVDGVGRQDALPGRPRQVDSGAEICEHDTGIMSEATAQQTCTNTDHRSSRPAPKNYCRAGQAPSTASLCTKLQHAAGL
jgi:hypothetical protein